jgi:hypothetical protein
MRKKTTHTLDTSALTKAWSDLFEENGVFDLEALNNQGWMSAIQICEKTSIPRTSLNYILINKGFEKKRFKISHNGVKREYCFYRPKE